MVLPVHTFQRVMWPLKVSEIPSSLASRMDTISNTYIRKWLGLPCCFSDTGLFGKNALQLPLKSINLGYKQEKTRLVFELKESRDEAVKRAGVTIRTGYRWKAQQEIDQAVNRLQHKEVMGRVQHSQAGLGWGEPVQFWSKATREQRKSMVVEEVSQVEQDRYLIKAVSQCKQGAWTRWEDISNRVITWADIWRTPQSRLSFLVRAAYDTLPCPRNLSQWFGSEDKCPLCNKANSGLQNILSGCNVALTQGRFRWRQNQMLRKLAEQLERCRVRANSSPVTLHPNVPFLKFKRLKYSDLAAECREGGWTTTIHPVKVGCRGFVGKSAIQLLRAAGTTGISLRRAIKELAEEAEKASYWLWLRRRDMNWGSVPQ